MDRLEISALHELMRHPRGNCVSIYFTTPATGTAVRENPIRLKNAVVEAESRLESHGCRSTLAREILAPARKLVDEPEYWKHLGHGLALFAAEGLFRAWRLPTEFAPSVHVGPRFHVLPLLTQWRHDGAFYVLSVHRNGVHLYRGDRYGLAPLDQQHLPPAAAESLHFDQPQPYSQAHSGNPSLPGKEGLVFHGHGGAADASKDELSLYFHQVDGAVRGLLGHNGVPLVFAGLRYQFHLYQQVNGYAGLVDQPIADHAGPVDLAVLHREACEALAPRWRKPLEIAQSQLRNGLGRGLATTDPLEALRAAQMGAVETLLVAEGAELPGRWHDDRQAAELCGAHQAGTEDLLNVAAILTVESGGRVLSTARDALPADAPAAALFRYEVVLPPALA